MSIVIRLNYTEKTKTNEVYKMYNTYNIILKEIQKKFGFWESTGSYPCEV